MWASENDLAEVEGGDYRAERDAQPFACLMQNFSALGFVFRIGQTRLQVRCGEPGLEAAELAACALSAAVGSHHDMADLTCGKAGPVHDLTANHDAGTHTTPHADEHHVPTGT